MGKQLPGHIQCFYTNGACWEFAIQAQERFGLGEIILIKTSAPRILKKNDYPQGSFIELHYVLRVDDDLYLDAEGLRDMATIRSAFDIRKNEKVLLETCPPVKGETFLKDDEFHALLDEAGWSDLAAVPDVTGIVYSNSYWKAQEVKTREWLKEIQDKRVADLSSCEP